MFQTMTTRSFLFLAVLALAGLSVSNSVHAQGYMRSMSDAKPVATLVPEPAAFPTEQADTPYTPAPIPAPQSMPYADAPAYAEPIQLSSARQTWSAREGQKLRDVLSVWATREGFALVWDTKYNYVMTTDFETSDTFYNAIEAIMDEFRRSAKHPKGTVHLDPVTGESFLVVQTKGER